MLATPLAVTMSWVHMPGLYPASNAIDGDPSTLVLSWTALRSNQWLSVQVPPGTRIGYVVVYNRDDGALYQSWLDPFEIWLGVGEGHNNVRHPCGGGPQTQASSHSVASATILRRIKRRSHPLGAGCGNVGVAPH